MAIFSLAVLHALIASGQTRHQYFHNQPSRFTAWRLLCFKPNAHRLFELARVLLHLITLVTSPDWLRSWKVVASVETQ
jgi:hypothetical protein